MIYESRGTPGGVHRAIGTILRHPHKHLWLGFAIVAEVRKIRLVAEGHDRNAFSRHDVSRILYCEIKQC